MKPFLLALSISATLWGYGEHASYWIPHGCDDGKKIAAKHGGHGKGESAMFALMNMEGNATSTLIRPDLSTIPLAMKRNTVILPKPRMGGYYALVSESRSGDTVYSAVRYLSLQGRPAKISPTRLTALTKSSLEIVPDPLHREHDRYTASKSYQFLLKYRDKPLANTSVTLETHNSAVQTYRSDDRGSFTITLPNDFKNVQIGRSENKPSEFLLNIEHKEEKTLYISTFSMPYYVNPNDYWQSQPYGAGAVFIGFLGGLFLYRRHKNQGVTRG